MKSGSNLERVLDRGTFAVAAEAGPPRGSSPEVMLEKGKLLKDCADALNVTDNQTAVARMSSLAGCVLLERTGAEAVLQMVVRDRNRLALQSDILGAAALGLKNVLCLSGDHQRLGNQPGARGVYDIDSMHLIRLVRMMRDEHRFLNGDEIKGDVPMYIGAAANPFADPFELRVLRLAKKVAAGADFIQTQAVFDVPKFKRWMQLVRDRGLDEKTHILAGVMPMKSAAIARRMHDGVAGVSLPQELLDRMESAKDAQEEGLKICMEIIQQLKEEQGVHGIHIMAIASESVIPRIVKEAGLMPRPRV